ncbi:MAG: hypothetical protein ABJN35_05730 [Erythrobacter sp.]
MKDYIFKNGSIRYRSYFWLMDLSLLVIVVAFAGTILYQGLGFRPIEISPGTVGVLNVIYSILGGWVPAILIVTSAIRDEYAEMIWKQTVGHLVWIATISPFAVFIGVWIAYAIAGGDTPPVWLGWLYNDTSPIQILMNVWGMFVVAFVVIFQFNRWRALS